MNLCSSIPYFFYFPALVVPQKDEQNTDPCPALQPKSCSTTSAASQEFPGGAADVCL